MFNGLQFRRSQFSRRLAVVGFQICEIPLYGDVAGMPLIVN